MPGGCDKPDMKTLTISRHNSAVQLLYKAIQASELGGCYTVMDAGHLPGELMHTRLPGWLLPDTEEDTRNKLRPDLLIVKGLTQRKANTWTARGRVRNKTRYTVYLIEVGYSSDTRLDDKEHTKLEQHQQLAELLRKEGWNVAYKAIPLGTTGGIHKTIVDTLTNDFKLDTKKVDATCNKLHNMAINMAHALVRKRRYLEYHDATNCTNTNNKHPNKWNNEKHRGTKRNKDTEQQGTERPCKRLKQKAGAVT